MKIIDNRPSTGYLEFHDTKPGEMYESTDTGGLYLGIELDGRRARLPFPKCHGLTSAMVDDSPLSRGTFRLLISTVEVQR